MPCPIHNRRKFRTRRAALNVPNRPRVFVASWPVTCAISPPVFMLFLFLHLSWGTIPNNVMRLGHYIVSVNSIVSWPHFSISISYLMITGQSQFRGHKSQWNGYFFVMELQLVPTEFRLLKHMQKHAGMVLIQSQLLITSRGFTNSEARNSWNQISADCDRRSKMIRHIPHLSSQFMGSTIDWPLLLQQRATLQKLRRRYNSKRLPIQKFTCLNEPSDKFQMSHVKVEVWQIIPRLLKSAAKMTESLNFRYRPPWIK